MIEILFGYFSYKNIKTLYRIIGGKIENENITLVFEPNSYLSK